MFDAGTDLRFGSVCFRSPLQHRFASRFLAMDATDLALAFESCLVCLAAIGRIDPGIRSGVIAGDDIAQYQIVEAGTIGDLAFANEAKGPADRHTAFVAKARDGDVDTRLAIYQGLALANLGDRFADLDR